MNPPTGLLTGDGNSEIIWQLRSWWKQHRRGRVTDSDTGFYLPDGSMLNPDAAYIGPERLNDCSDKETGFPHLCPDFVVELMSKSDRVVDVQKKMADWITNGVLVGWLIDPYQRMMVVYEQNRSPYTLNATSVTAAFGWVESFTLELNEIWSCYE